MPTNKPRVQTILNQETYAKLKRICEKEHRTESNLTALIIEKYIEEYEQKNGIVEIKEA